MAKKISRARHIRQTAFRKDRSIHRKYLDRVLLPFLLPIFSIPVTIVGLLAIASLLFLWRDRRWKGISDIVSFNILIGCLIYLAGGFFVYVNNEREEIDRLLSLTYLKFSQEQDFLVLFLTLSVTLLIPIALSVIVIKRQHYIDRKIRSQRERQHIHVEKEDIQYSQSKSQGNRNQQDQQYIHAEHEIEAKPFQEEHLKFQSQQDQQCIKTDQGQDARHSKEEFQQRLNKVFVSTAREDYLINRTDYRRGNTREREYRRRYLLKLLSLYENQCARCGRSDNGFEIDHFFISKNEGGNFALIHKDGYLVNNAIPLCRSCNSSKGDRSYRTFFSNREILSLFTKNREMTLLLNAISSLDHIQLEIQGILPEKIQPAITIDKDEEKNLIDASSLSLDKPKEDVLKDKEEWQTELASEQLTEGRQQQRLHLLNSQDKLISEKELSYTHLRDLLKAEKWKDADRKTYELMILAVGRRPGQWFTSEELLNFPCVDLYTIDELWIKYSQGRFGFSVQQKIYVKCGAQLDGRYPGDVVWREFCNCVGWETAKKDRSYNSLNAELFSFCEGELPHGLPIAWGWGRSFPSLAKRLVSCEIYIP